MDVDSFREELLQVMESKVHWAWPAFGSGLVPRDKLHTHFEQEYEVYVRDFAVLIGRAFVQCPVPEVRQELAENLFEEETGGLVAGRPHYELFLQYPKGLGFDMTRYDNIELSPNAKIYRDLLDDLTENQGWAIAATVSTIFVEGTAYERGEIEEGAPKRPSPPLSEHPLVIHYGLSLEDLALTKAHREVEGEHRAAAWRIVLDHVPELDRSSVVSSMKEVCDAWKLYRDDVAHACGLSAEVGGGVALKAI